MVIQFADLSKNDFCHFEKQLYNVSCKELGNILNFVSRPWSKKDFPDDKFEYIEISSVDKEHGITGTKTIYVNKAPSRATTLVKQGDIILSTTRPYLGAFAFVTPEYNNCVCTSGFALADGLKTKSIDKEFLLYFLKSDGGLRQMERYMTGGLYPAIVQSELEKIKVPMPDITKQRQIVNQIKEEEKNQNKTMLEANKKFVEAKKNLESIILGKNKIEEL